jgi:imidazole glycerol-phosphate synthase subunit HisH
MKYEMVIIDYGMGNLNSVKRKFYRIGVTAEITSNHLDILNAEKIVLPGVGHFQKAVENLKHLKLWDALNTAVLVKKTPILGICLGMQLMAKKSEEGEVEGLGWFDAEVVRFRIHDPLKFKVPHMGWNHVTIKKPSKLFDDVNLDSGFYFVHSYHLKCNDSSDILNETLYEYPFVSAIQRDNITGLQYHPEKSHDAGEQLLRNFVKI